MTWPASRRYDLDTAPGGLALVQDFLNTRARPSQETADLLATVRAAQSWADEALRLWSEESGARHRKPRLATADVHVLRSLRSDLAAALRDRENAHDHEFGSGAILADVGVSGEMALDGTVSLEPAAQGWRRIGSAILIEAYRAQVSNTWRRLKVCRNEKCPGAFYDRSPNNSGAWHDVRTCGNVANLRAARARKAAAR